MKNTNKKSVIAVVWAIAIGSLSLSICIACLAPQLGALGAVFALIFAFAAASADLLRGQHPTAVGVDPMAKTTSQNKNVA